MIPGTWRRRTTYAATSLLLAGAAPAAGIPPAAGAPAPAASFPALTVQGVPCSATPVFVDAPAPDSSWYEGLVVAGTVGFSGGAAVTTRLIRPDGGIIHTSQGGIGPEGEFRVFVDPRETDEGTPYTIRVTTTTVSGDAGPAADCQVFVRSGPEYRPRVHPLLGAGEVYPVARLETPSPRGGAGVAGAFVARTDEPGVVGFEYQMAPRGLALPEWARVEGNPAVIPVLPETSGIYDLHVRAVDADGLVGYRDMAAFAVAAPGQAQQALPPVTVHDVIDLDPADGQTPAEVLFSRDLRYSYGTIDLFRGETLIGSVEGDGRGAGFARYPVTIDTGVLGQGLAEVRAEYRAFDGAPVVESIQHVCADSCQFSPASARIGGTAAPGAVLTAALDVAPAAATVRYQWHRDGVAITGQTASTYGVQLDDGGHEIGVTVTGARPRFTDVSASTSVAIPALPDGHRLTVAYSEYDTGLRSTNGATLGLVGQSRPLHGFDVRLTNEDANGVVSATAVGAIEGAVHLSGFGWTTTQPGERLAAGVSTTRIEAVRLTLTGSIAQRWDLYYRVHTQDLGWLGWAKNGQDAGTTGYGLRVEAIEVRLVPKGGAAPAGTLLAAAYDPVTSSSRVLVEAHVESLGWLSPVEGGETAGTTGEARRVEALRFGTHVGQSGVQGQAHVQDYGWLPYVSSGVVVGTTGESKRVEAFRFRLVDRLAEQYDVYYRTHAQNFGWLGWAKNGEPSGTAGYAYRLEAVQVVLVPKGGPAPSGTGTPFYEK